MPTLRPRSWTTPGANGTSTQQLTFGSSGSAFQVQAGDKMANALLGNFAQNAVLTGSDNSATVSSTGLSFSSLKVDGNAVSLAAATVNALAGGAVAASSTITGLATVSDSAIAAASLTGAAINPQCRWGFDDSTVTLFGRRDIAFANCRRDYGCWRRCNGQPHFRVPGSTEALIFFQHHRHQLKCQRHRQRLANHDGRSGDHHGLHRRGYRRQRYYGGSTTATSGSVSRTPA